MPEPKSPATQRALTPLRASLIALLIAIGSAWHAPVVTPLAAHAAIRPVAGSAPAPAAAAPLAADNEDDQDEEQADGGPPPEPQLERIPAAPAADPQAIAVSDRTMRSPHLPRT